ncbi:MAG: galactokinase [Actinomycetota bacterium]
MVNVDVAVDLHRSEFDTSPTVVATAPGRVNLIGEHTDYNDGFVLPMAIPFGTAVAAAPRTDRRVVGCSESFGPTRFDLDAAPTSTDGWGRYLHGMAWALADHGVAVDGFTCTVVSDIPGSSLSSSAALEMATGTAIAALAATSLDPATLATIGQRVEHEVIGVPVGIMDQLISAAGVAGSASLIDCRSLAIEPTPIPASARIVVLDTGTRRGLVDSEYAARRAACERVAAALGVAALRDASLEGLDALADLDPVDRRRARHVISENDRTLEAARASAAGDIERLGALMDASHDSLHVDFEVTGPAPDAAVRLARTLDGCLGARMTGAGFAGAAIALVEVDAVDRFAAEMAERFVAPPEQPSTEPPAFHVVWPVQGAHVVQPTA